MLNFDQINKIPVAVLQHRRCLLNQHILVFFIISANFDDQNGDWETFCAHQLLQGSLEVIDYASHEQRQHVVVVDLRDVLL